jgi:hypothetical protein
MDLTRSAHMSASKRGAAGSEVGPRGGIGLVGRMGGMAAHEADFVLFFLFSIPNSNLYFYFSFQIFQMYQLKSKGEYKPYYFIITSLSFILLVYLFHEMYKWFPLKEKFFFSSFFLFPNDTLFRFLLPIPNSEFGCYTS